MLAGVFIVDCIRPLHCFLGRFHFTNFIYCHCFLLLRILCCCTASATDLREHLFTLRTFLPYTLSRHLAQPALIRVFWWWQFCLEGCRASHWGLRQRPNPSLCLSHTVFGSFMISRELYLNLSKFVDTLLVVTILINFKRFSEKCYYLIDYWFHSFFFKEILLT